MRDTRTEEIVMMTSRTRPGRSGTAFWVAVVVLGAIALAVAWGLPPAASHRVAIPSPQWVTGL